MDLRETEGIAIDDNTGVPRNIDLWGAMAVVAAGCLEESRVSQTQVDCGGELLVFPRGVYVYR